MRDRILFLPIVLVGSPHKLKHYGIENRAEELNKAAAEISREAAGDDHYVFGINGTDRCYAHDG